MSFSRAERAVVTDWWLTVDRTLLALILVLAISGAMASLVASPQTAIHLKLEPFYFVKRHAAGAIVALAIVFVGLLSVAFRLEKTAYRYASITLAIVVLIPRSNPPWNVALHRFIEVSVGIIVALLVVAVWPERSPIAAKSADE